MDIDELKSFKAIAELGSFSAAADELHITQPAISKRIASLEDSLNTELFDRIGRQVILTEAGRILLPKAELILNELKSTKKLISDLSETTAGQLNLATSHHIGLHRLPYILKIFSTKYPDVRLNVQFIDSESAFEALRSGNIDLAIITLPPKIDNDLHYKAIWVDELCFLAAKTHPLYNQHDPDVKLALKQLSQYDAILPSSNTFTRQIVSKCFEKEKLSLQPAMSTNYLETIKMMVKVGLGWSVLPRSMIDEEVLPLPVKAEKMHRTLGYVHHKNRHITNASKALIQLLDASKPFSER